MRHENWLSAIPFTKLAELWRYVSCRGEGRFAAQPAAERQIVMRTRLAQYAASLAATGDGRDIAVLSTHHIHDACGRRCSSGCCLVQGSAGSHGVVESWIGSRHGGAPFFLGEPERNGWECPAKLGTTSLRVEVFCDDPDALIARALRAGAKGSLGDIKNHKMSWGTHRQGGFIDPFGHIWLVGDRSPLSRFP